MKRNETNKKKNKNKKKKKKKRERLRKAGRETVPLEYRVWPLLVFLLQVFHQLLDLALLTRAGDGEDEKEEQE